MALSKAEKLRRTEEAREAAYTLREIMMTAGMAYPHRPEETARRVYVSVTSVSRSGMSRRMRVYVGNRTTGEIHNITGRVGLVLDWHTNDNGIRVDGCGMDMGFHLVHSLSHALYGDGYALAKEWL